MNKRQKLVQQQFLNDEEKIIKRLNAVYKQSLSDVSDKVKNLSFQIGKLQKTYDWLDPNDPERERVKSMIQSKIYQKQYQEQLHKQLDDIVDKIKTKQFTTVSSYLDECYTNGVVGTMFDLHGQGIPLIMPIDQESMVRAVQLDSKISKGLYTRLGEDVDLLKRKIIGQVSRGIATGMTYAQVAKGLSDYTRIGFNNAVRIARTEGHRIQNQAAMDTMCIAKEKGADIVKQWDATLDGATRESHAAVDGEIRELDKPFSNGLMFAGDPNGGAAEVVNCRCATLQRARAALDEEELKTLQDRAAFFGLDKSEQFDDFKKNYLKALTNNGNGDTIALDKSTPIQGKNLIGDIDYNNSEFDHDIETAMHAQGFDGLPQVVDNEEFEEALKKSNFYAERTYSANSQELLDEYREQLYNGKWYVDCSTGGAQYGQGMYCAARFEKGKYIIPNDNNIGWEMSHYQQLNVQRGNKFSYVEGLTLQPDAKIITLYNDTSDIINRYAKEYALKNAQSEEAKDIIRKMIDLQDKIDIQSNRNFVDRVDWDIVDEFYKERNALFDLDIYQKEIKPLMDKGFNLAVKKNEGALAVEMGYDAINAQGHGKSGSYTVILNRTKVIFNKGGSRYGN